MIIIKDKLEIRHSTSGRIRFKVYSIRSNKEKSDKLSRKLGTIKGVIWARGNYASASLIIRYNQAVISKSELIETVKSVFSPKEKMPVPRKNTECSCLKSKENSVTTAVIRFIAMTVITAVLFIREVIFKLPLAQNLFSPLGIITALSALPLFKKGLENLKEKRFTLESFLGGSILIAVIAGEAAAALEILWITSGAELLKSWITERSRRAIRDILEVTEKSTYILVNGVEVEIQVKDVQSGDTVVVHTGEKISVDGMITDGEALVDESPINGRSEPILRQSGSQVFAGTFVRQGVIYIHAEKVGDKTYLSRILKMVEESLENKAPIEGVAEELAARLIKTGFGVTFVTLLITRSFWRAFTVMLVMACPCATILAASTAVSAALSAAAKRHILIKGGRYLEEAGKADMICFDKTGTLTTNQPELVKLVNLSDMTESRILQLACSAEKHNSHPVALAVKAEAAKQGIEPITHEVCEYMLGKGVRSEIEGEEILVGSRKLMDAYAVNTNTGHKIIRGFDLQGLTTIFIAKNRNLLGVMCFANRMRPDAEKVIKYLKNDGINEIAVITGDEKDAALGLTRRLEISDCYYSVMPEEKSDIVISLKKNGHKVLMVGDGINDALALAEADIGVAMGAGGSEVAIEAADIALVTDDLKGIVYVRSLSHATIKVVHQNFWIATGSNIAGVVLGAFGVLSPVMAGMIHIVHTLGILANSSRLLFYEAPSIPNGKLVILSDQKNQTESEVLNFEEMKKIA